MVSDRQSRPLAKLATLLLVILFIVVCSYPTTSQAATRRWEGGHNIRGCPEPSRNFYFAEGNTRNGFEEFLRIGNPGQGTANVLVTCLFAKGEESLEREYQVLPFSTLTVSVKDLVGRDRDLSLVVEADTEITAERPVFFNYLGIWTGGHNSPGATSPSESWYFAEGTTRDGFVEWLCLQNPNAQIARVDFTYMLDGGDTIAKEIELAPRTRTTVQVADHVGPGRDVSVLVSSNIPIVAERPMYFDYHGLYRGGHTLTGEREMREEWYFAEGCTHDGFEEWLSIQNPGPANKALVTYIFPDGAPISREHDLPPRSRTTISVNEEAGPGRDVSVKIAADSPVVAERPVYFGYGEDSWEGGHTLAGLSEGSKTWYLSAPGEGENASPWLCLANFKDEDAQVTVRVLQANTILSEERLILNPLTRRTLDLRDYPGLSAEALLEVSADDEVVVERPVYFSYEPQNSHNPFTFAAWHGLELICPVPYHELTAIIFHEGAPLTRGNRRSSLQAMQPEGTLMRDDNPRMLHPGVDHSHPGTAAYFIEDTRWRGSYSTTACDVQSKAGTVVYAPVSGTVIAAESYLLYRKYPDMRVIIAPDGLPGYEIALLHMDSLSVSAGQRLTAGETPVGTVRDLVPYFHSGPNPYTREEGNHVHVQIDHRP